MPLTPHISDIALRLVLSFVAGMLIGINRGERGRPAGLRTTLLVCLAASVTMIQVNLLLGMVGKAASSFIQLDLMRLPLGILSGMGFIGGGAILRTDRFVTGVTTAATLWFVTVIGLCYGGGQIALGSVALGLAMVVLWVLEKIEERMSHDRRAELTLVTTLDGPTEADLHNVLTAERLEISSLAVTYSQPERQRELRYEIWWHGRRRENRVPPLLDRLAARPDVLKLEWRT